MRMVVEFTPETLDIVKMSRFSGCEEGRNDRAFMAALITHRVGRRGVSEDYYHIEKIAKHIANVSERDVIYL